MLAMNCAQCGKSFEAQRKTAQYCTSKCRVAATRERQRTGSVADVPRLPRRREGAALVVLPVPTDDAKSISAVTAQQLRDAGRLMTPAGLLAVKLAQILDSGVQDTGSSIAALGRQYLLTMEQALSGAKKAETPLEKIRREREMKTG